MPPSLRIKCLCSVVPPARHHHVLDASHGPGMELMCLSETVFVAIVLDDFAVRKFWFFASFQLLPRPLSGICIRAPVQILPALIAGKHKNSHKEYKCRAID